MKDIFSGIRPYFDSEIQAALELLLSNDVFMQGAKQMFSDEIIENFKEIYPKFDTINSLQENFILPMLQIFLQKKSCNLTFSGIENINQPAIFISNHRDILVDPACLQLILVNNGFITTQIAVGNNLAAADWILAFMRLNKSFIIKRNLPKGEQIAAFKELSAYIRRTITESSESIWIAQREGRAKDSNDFTQPSIIKMFSLSGRGSLIENIKSLNICPLSISYEYDACDFLKVKEFLQRIENEHFTKTTQDDVLSMKTGIFGCTGNLHYAFNACINDELDKISEQKLHRNEQVEQITGIIDRKIHSSYKFFPINYFAYDKLYNERNFEKFYQNEKENLEQYFENQINKIDLPNFDRKLAEKRFLEMYSNTLKNLFSAISKDVLSNSDSDMEHGGCFVKYVSKLSL